jgi:hypothetical protein
MVVFAVVGALGRERIVTAGGLMKRLSFALLFLIILSSAAFAQVGVRGYTRSDGTYVQPHQRTAPDNTINNNYSTYPNINPHTGQQGHIQPNYGPSYQQPNYGSTYNRQRGY